MIDQGVHIEKEEDVPNRADVDVLLRKLQRVWRPIIPYN